MLPTTLGRDRHGFFTGVSVTTRFWAVSI